MSFVQKSAINLASNLALPLTSFLTAPILAHGLGVSGRGEVAGATAPLFLFAAMGALGLPDALTYFIARSQGDPKKYLGTAIWSSLLAGALFTVVLFFLSSGLSRGDTDLRRLMVTAGVALIPTLLVGVMRGAAIGLQRFRLVFWERIFAYGGRMMVLCGLWFFDGLTPLSASATMAYLPLLGSVVYVPLLLSQRPALGRFDARVLKYGLLLWIGSLSGVILLRVDQLLMIPLSSAIELGLYAVAVSIGELPLVFNASLREVLFAVDSADNNRERVARVGRLSTLITTVVCIVIACLCPFAVPLLFGQQFSSSVGVCMILLGAVVVGNPGSIAGTALTSLGRPGLRSASLTLACSVNVVAVLLLVPHHGAVGAAWAMLVGNLVAGNTAIVFCRSFAGYKFLDFYGIRLGDIQSFIRAVGWAN